MKNNYTNYTINLSTKSPSISNLKLKVYKNASTTASETINGTYDSTTSTVKYVVSTSNYDIGDELTFRLTRTSSTNIINTEEGLTVLLNGEEVDTIRGSDYYTFNTHNNGDYSLELVYKGNDATEMASTGIKRFNVKQEIVENPESSSPSAPTVQDLPNGRFTIEFADPNLKQLSYNQGNIQYIVKKGGTPVYNVPVRITTPTATADKVTDPTGVVTMQNTNYPVGEYTLGAYIVYDNTKIEDIYKKIKIVKSPTTITHNASDNRVAKGSKFSISVTYPNGGKVKDDLVTLYINGNKFIRKLNSAGNLWITVKDRKTYKFTVQYSGNKNLKGSSATFNIVGY